MESSNAKEYCLFGKITRLKLVEKYSVWQYPLKELKENKLTSLEMEQDDCSVDEVIK